MTENTEKQVEDVPFRRRRPCRWGDCDPAGIIYTPRTFDYAVELLESWYRDYLGVTWMTLNWEMHMGAPMVRAECDYIRAPRPDEDVTLELRIDRLGRSSITYVILATDGGGRHLFRVTLVSCIIERPDFRSLAIPPEIRGRMEAYRAACGDDQPTKEDDP